ncbi:hypothetical protein [Methylosinus sp. R-45379]|uniref:hypothetical protein n=1 Tax=Methylosinus sp. R-45379 TaxID=980563 RepID=UPI0012EE1DC2|nr:hypothetical protein [Methylosinus sp. R-45379]
MSDALMRIGQVESVLGDIVQARIYIDPGVRLVPVHLEGLEHGPGAVLLRQIHPVLDAREAEHAALASESVY